MNYIAQVLKRNSHLKVLNLSENRIDAAGLASLAEALASLFPVAVDRFFLTNRLERLLALEQMPRDARPQS